MTDERVATQGGADTMREAGSTDTLVLAPPTGLPSADAAVDRWDAAAHLETAGFSAAAARRAGFADTFDLAGSILAAANPTARAGLPSRPAHFFAAVARSLLMLAGVAVCVSTIPQSTSEVHVFAIAALAWLSGQVVSAATWHSWGRGSRADGAAAGRSAVWTMLVIGVLVALPMGEPTALIWIMWTASLPILIILRPGPVVTFLALGVAAACWASRQFWGYGPTVVIALITTSAALAAALVLTHRIARERSSQDRPGHLRSVIVATVQTIGQLGTLLAVVLLIGPGAFGGVAVAGLFAALLADPVFELANRAARWLAAHSSHWFSGRLAMHAVGALTVTAVVALALWISDWFLDDPYVVYADLSLALACGALVGALTAAIAILLRSGRALTAMVLALATAAVVGIAAAITAADYHQGPVLFPLLAAAVSVVAALLAGRCLADPRTW